jgi:hypothetical protein
MLLLRCAALQPCVNHHTTPVCASSVCCAYGLHDPIYGQQRISRLVSLLGVVAVSGQVGRIA